MDDKAFPLHEHNWHNWLVSMNGIAVERHAVERHAVVFSHGLILPSAEISAQLQPSRARKREREREREGFKNFSKIIKILFIKNSSLKKSFTNSFFGECLLII